MSDKQYSSQHGPSYLQWNSVLVLHQRFARETVNQAVWDASI